AVRLCAAGAPSVTVDVRARWRRSVVRAGKADSTRLGAFVVLATAALACVACGMAQQPERVLRVCADPNNLPFSNERGEGLENRLAEMVADEMNAQVEYTWWAQRRGFVRNTLRAGECDVIM